MACSRSVKGTFEPDKIDHLEPKKKQGLFVVLTGNGKGKTTSALGIAVSEVREVKHAYRKEIEPQPGIDY